MVPIHKGPEPQELVAHRKTPCATYGGMPGKETIRKSLLREQGSICAYCMRRINLANSQIEHWDAQANGRGNDLDYGNMLAVCDGKWASVAGQTCGAAKEEKTLKYNPAVQADADRMRISYNPHDGAIGSEDREFNAQLEDVLNLNLPLLKNNRLAEWKAAQKALKNGKKLAELAKKYRPSTDINPEYREYCGIVDYFLRRKMKNRG